MEEIHYEITLKFPCFCKVAEFLRDLENWQAWKQQKADKREADQRGKHTKEFHQRARQFQADHPMFSYRECYKIANERR